MTDTNDELVALRAENERLRRTRLTDRDDDLADLRGARDHALSLVAERDDALAGRKASVLELRAEVARLRVQLAEATAEIERLKQGIADYDSLLISTNNLHLNKG